MGDPGGIFTIGALALSIAACSAMRAERARENLDSMIGQPVSELALKLGPPVTAFSTGGGTMASQWESRGLHRAPGHIEYGQCRLSVVARSSALTPTLADWIIERWEYTGNACV